MDSLCFAKGDKTNTSKLSELSVSCFSLSLYRHRLHFNMINVSTQTSVDTVKKNIYRNISLYSMFNIIVTGINITREQCI